MAWETEIIGELIEPGVLSVADDGSVWRHQRVSHGVLRPLLTPRRIDLDAGRGYRKIRVQLACGPRSCTVHRLIWTLANGEIPDSAQINHIDGDRSNNTIDNLELTSAHENIRHSYNQLNRKRPWTSTDVWRGRPRVTSEQIDEMVSQRHQGATLKEIAADHGISISHVQRLVGGKKGEPR